MSHTEKHIVYKPTDWVNYRKLQKDEIIRKDDETLYDKKGWCRTLNCVGGRAPDPSYSSHRWYRRLK